AHICASLGPGAPLLSVPAKGARTIYSDLQAAGIDYADHGDGRLDFHSLRGSHAALLFHVGGELPEVQKSMGHADPELTMHYAKGRRDKQNKLLDSVVE